MENEKPKIGYMLSELEFEFEFELLAQMNMCLLVIDRINSFQAICVQRNERGRSQGIEWSEIQLNS